MDFLAEKLQFISWYNFALKILFLRIFDLAPPNLLVNHYSKSWFWAIEITTIKFHLKSSILCPSMFFLWIKLTKVYVKDILNNLLYSNIIKRYFQKNHPLNFLQRYTWYGKAESLIKHFAILFIIFIVSIIRPISVVIILLSINNY